MLGLEDTRDCASVIFILLGTMGFSNLNDQMLRSLCQRHGKVFVSQELTVDSELQCFQLSDLGSRGQVWVTTSTRHLRLPGIQCGPIHSFGNPRVDSCTHSAMQVRTVGLRELHGLLEIFQQWVETQSSNLLTLPDLLTCKQMINPLGCCSSYCL